jgi:hypothetical protein
MKTVASQYQDTLTQSQKCKPRSRRKIVLTERLCKLMTRQLKIENRKSA